MKLLSSLLLVLFALCQLFLTGCSNPYAKYYEDFGTKPATISQHYDYPEVTYCEPWEFQDMMNAYLAHGFNVQGSSSFLGDSEYMNNHMVIRQAVRCGASAAIFSAFTSRDLNTLRALGNQSFKNDTQSALPWAERFQAGILNTVMSCGWFLTSADDIAESFFNVSGTPFQLTSGGEAVVREVKGVNYPKHLEPNDRLYIALFFY